MIITMLKFGVLSVMSGMVLFAQAELKFEFDGKSYTHDNRYSPYFTAPRMSPSDSGDYLYLATTDWLDESIYGVDTAAGHLVQVRRTVSGSVDIPAVSFYGCNGYTSIYIYYIDAYCFENCTNVTSVVLPSSVKEIRDRAFKGCSKLSSITIPSGVSFIGSKTFEGCDLLTSLKLPASVKTLSSELFGPSSHELASIVFEGAPPNGLVDSGLFKLSDNITISKGSLSEWATFCIQNTSVSINATNGMTFADMGSSYTIRMQYPVADAIIRYTLDGSDPTSMSSAYSSKFKIVSNTTIRAAAFLDDVRLTPINSVSIAPNKINTPVINPINGTVYHSIEQLVSIECDSLGSRIYYTLDGSEPTVCSTLYQGSFKVKGSVVIKAKAFDDVNFPSETAISSLICEYRTLQQPQVVFYKGDSVVDVIATNLIGRYVYVDITNSVPGCSIFYTIERSNSDCTWQRFSGRFKVLDPCVIKTFAAMDDWQDSLTNIVELVKVSNLGDGLNCPELNVCNDPDSPWVLDVSEKFNGYSSLRSGVVDDSEKTEVTISVNGSGHVLFAWKCVCEEDPYDHQYDHGEFLVDDKEVLNRIDGSIQWKTEDYYIESGGAHVLKWVYVKDEDDDKYYDGGNIWLSRVVWIPDDATMTTLRGKAEVPYSWLYENGLLDDLTPEDAANSVSKYGKKSGDGHVLTACEEYIQGTKPSVEDDVFVASIDMSSCVPVITWMPSLKDRVYVIWSTDKLHGGTWTNGVSDASRFFKVTVEMK